MLTEKTRGTNLHFENRRRAIYLRWIPTCLRILLQRCRIHTGRNCARPRNFGQKMKLLKTYRFQHGQAYTPDRAEKEFQGLDPQTFQEVQAALTQPNRYCDVEFYGDKHVQIVIVVQRPDSWGIGNNAARRTYNLFPRKNDCHCHSLEWRTPRLAGYSAHSGYTRLETKRLPLLHR
jgi:hypothetical protein